jgi:hypothetical protein
VQAQVAVTPRARVVGLGLLGMIVATYVWWPMLWAWTSTQFGDGQYFHKLVEAGRVSVAHHHELPLWDPYECGGRPLWDNPQSLVAAPLVWLALLFGTTFTMKLWYVAHTAAGFVAMWLFCREDLRVSRLASFAASVAWAAAGFHMHHLSGGHAAFVGFEYMPAALWLWRLAEKSERAAIALGLLVALVAFEGGALPLLYVAVLLGGETLTRLGSVKRILAIVKNGSIVLCVGVGVGAVRLFPVIDQLRSHKRPLPVDTDVMGLEALFDAFTNRRLGHMQHVPNLVYVWGEYGAYIGLFLLLLGVLGLFVAGRERAWMAALLALSIALMVGDHGPHSPWSILNRHVYPLKEMRVPSRFCAEASLFLLAYAAIAVDRLEALVLRIPKLPSPVAAAAQLVPAMIAIAAAGDVAGRGMQLVAEYAAVDAPQGKDVVPSQRLYLGGPGLAPHIDQPQQNRGRIQCYDPWAFYEGAPLWEGDVPQARSADEKSRVVRARRTQNTFTFDVEADAPARVLLNTSFDYNWRASVGAPVEHQKLLAVDVPAGNNHVVMRYRPRFLTFGAVVSIVSALAVYYALRRRRNDPPPRIPA